MNFCPHCKSALLPEKRNTTVTFVCVRCGWTSEAPRVVTKALGKAEQSVFIVEKQRTTRPDRKRSRPKQNDANP